MKRKISSNLTVFFQVAAVLQFMTITSICFVVLFRSNVTTILIFMAFLVLGLIILKLSGTHKLKTVYWHGNSLFIGSLNSKYEVPIANIKAIKRTFLFDDFPHKIRYIETGKIKEIYFLPKSRLLQFFYSENEIIEELKEAIKKSKDTKV